MTFKCFFSRSIGISLVVALAFVTFNVAMNEFGLYGDARGKRLMVHSAEKTTKYLLSFNYIPANYDGVIIGPSVSDQLDPRKIHGYRLYNLSILSGNVLELKLPVFNVIERGKLRLLVICLHPYMTRDSILRDKRVTPDMYWSALGSTFTFKFYTDMLLNRLDSSRDTFTDSADGYSRPIHAQGITTEAFVDRFVKDVTRGGGRLTPLNPGAYADLREIIARARQKGVRIVAYFHPEVAPVYRAYEESYNGFKREMRKLFTDDDLVYDFNTPQYEPFRADLSNYIDHGHLSEKGASFIVAELDRVIGGTPRPVDGTGRPQ